jgi:predicted NBD/HSP70 family sugar kinase
MVDMWYIGFDIGGTKCAVSLGRWENQEISIVERQETPTKRIRWIRWRH